MTRIEYPAIKDIIKFNKIATNRTNEPHGVHQPANLEFYLHEMKTQFRFKTKRKTVLYKASLFIHRMATSQTFVEANTRTGWGIGISFLHANDIYPQYTAKDAFIHAENIRNERVAIVQTVLWFRRHLSS